MAKLDPQKWYDRMAKHYDRSETSGDRKRRRLAIERLDPRPADTVLVPGCGTGLDFPLLVDAVGPGGHVVGVDYSEAMLQRAESLAQREGWTNVTLIHADAGALSADFLDEHAGVREVDGLLLNYVLSITPSWEIVFERAFSLLRESGRCVISDIKPAVGLARVANPFLYAFWKLGAADVRRRVDSLMEGRVNGLEVTRTRLFVLAGGTKRSGARDMIE